MVDSNLQGLKLQPGCQSTCLNNRDKVPTSILRIQKVYLTGMIGLGLLTSASVMQ